MLNSYLQQTQKFLHDEKMQMFNPEDLIGYINTMRGQLASQSRCIRSGGTITVTPNQFFFSLSSIVLNEAGAAGALHVRSMFYNVGSGQKWITPRPWEWFEFYVQNTPVPVEGPPRQWAVYRQGSAGTGTEANPGTGTMNSGTIYFYPAADIAYGFNLDCVCYPIALKTDADREAIPYQWTDAVPYGAAWMAMLSAGPDCQPNAEKYFNYFNQYVQRARDGSSPDVVRYQYDQQPNITLPNQLGISAGKGGQ